jgi:REP element-mobilizing transposase RayT
LPVDLYRGFKVVSITACLEHRAAYFTKVERFRICEKLLVYSLARFNCEAEVYLFMPDHAHFLVRGNSDLADVLQAMNLFKQKTGFWLSQGSRCVRWQKRYFDHIIRKDEEVKKHFRYILENPVRSRLVEHWRQYPFKGSTIYDLNYFNLV